MLGFYEPGTLYAGRGVVHWPDQLDGSEAFLCLLVPTMSSQINTEN